MNNLASLNLEWVEVTYLFELGMETQERGVIIGYFFHPELK